MVYIALKTVLNTVVVALVASTQIQAAPVKGTLSAEEDQRITGTYKDTMFQPTKVYNLCKARCYTQSLNHYVKIDQIEKVDKCVDNLLAKMKTYDDVVQNFDDKKEIYHWNMAQYCADSVVHTGQVPFWHALKIPVIQLNAMKCSVDKCDGPYGDARLEAFKVAVVEVEDALKD
ncbi:hypothetical protein EC968_000140 [Mortierella alpina]|nr:hypothetical protein EC968_000140 [Mortierella alpina]